jgi:two-component system CheB/CheR fusion protein
MNEHCPIVGIGASAGGLEALETFFKYMPDNSGMAFVVVMHLDPSHVSLLPELLQRQTKMEVVKIQRSEKVEANKIYVIPPNKNLQISDGVLELIEHQNLRIKLPIDSFFKSLAHDQGNNAACIILSGTGADGTLGLKEIIAESGFALAQSTTSAKYDGMPKNAISTGLVNSILDPSEMPKQIIDHFTSSVMNIANKLGDTEILTNILSKILLIIKNQTGHDFFLYKKKTIFRRIERRMQIHHIDNINNYLALIQKDNQEVTILFRDLLIGVTSFFRDKDAFDVLANNILPEFLDKKPNNYTVRVWIPGCSSGEEAYSIAIILQEYIAASDKNMNIQIFATDVDEYAIERARSGQYPETVIDELGEEYCQRYFIKNDSYYRVKKSLRELVIFATQNLIQDPPFSKLDIICCRNLLIYFSPELQRNIFPIFHYSLNEGGILFLGPSETTGQSNNYFEILNKKWKLFKRKPLSKNSSTGLLYTESLSPLKMEKKNTLSTTTQITELSALHLVEIILKKHNVPPCVIIDSQMNIIYVHGRLGHYLEPAEGRLSSNILEMTRTPALKQELSKAIRKAILHKKDVHKKSIPVGIDDDKLFLDLTVKLLKEIGNLKDLLMIDFSERTPTPQAAVLNTQSQPSSDASILHKELENIRDDLQTTIEELETSNEELKSANEELQSTNEELQSTNEELETSKEELQSLNEESVTVNAELQSHIDELSMANDDIKNLLDSTQVATLFLDTQLKIRRFTPKMKEIIHLMPSDIHRPISHLSSSLQNIKLTDVAGDVLQTLEKTELEVSDDKNKIYRMRTLPYRTANNVIAGVVISFEDITTIKQTENALRDSEYRYKSLFDNSPFTVLEVDASGLVEYMDTHNLTTLEILDSHLKTKDLNTDDMTSLISVLNINDSGVLLFEGLDKESLLKQLPKLFEATTFLVNHMQAIIEHKSKLVFAMKIHTISHKTLECQISITIPKVKKGTHSVNSILVLTPEVNT